MVNQEELTNKKKNHFFSFKWLRFSLFKKSEKKIDTPPPETNTIGTVPHIQNEEETPNYLSGGYTYVAPHQNSDSLQSQEAEPLAAVSPLSTEDSPRVHGQSQSNTGQPQTTTPVDHSLTDPDSTLSPGSEHVHPWATTDQVVRPPELADTGVSPNPPQETGLDAQGQLVELPTDNQPSQHTSTSPRELPASPVGDMCFGFSGKTRSIDRPPERVAGRFEPLGPPRYLYEGFDPMSHIESVRAYNEGWKGQQNHRLQKNFQTGNPTNYQPSRFPVPQHGGVSQSQVSENTQNQTSPMHNTQHGTNSNPEMFGTLQNEQEHGHRGGGVPLKQLGPIESDQGWDVEGNTEKVPGMMRRFRMSMIGKSSKAVEPNLGDSHFQSRTGDEDKMQVIVRQNSDIRTLNEEVKNLKDKLKKAEDSEHATSKKLTTANADLSDSQARVSRLEDELETKEARITEVEKDLEDTEGQLHAAIWERDQAQKETKDRDKQWQEFHNTQVANAEQRHQNKIREMDTKHEEAVSLLEEDYNRQTKELQDKLKQDQEEHDVTLRKMKEEADERYETATISLNGQIMDLKKYMASQRTTGGYTAISDDDFRGRFKALAQRINNLIAYVPRPSSMSVDTHLDPTSFLSRNAQQGGRIWPKFIRNVCWRVIIKGFYSYQPGFGALGPPGTQGHQFLDHFFQLNSVPDPQDPTGLTATWLNTSPNNILRAGYFNAITKAVHDRASILEHNPFLALFYENVRNVTDELVSALQIASQNHLNPQAPTEVAAIVGGFAIMALDMGSQRAHVMVESCQYGEEVATGERFNDETEQRRGTLAVDLMTQPCLRRIGDGREDTKVQRMIVKGDFIAVKTGWLN